MPKTPAEIKIIVDDFLERLGPAYLDEPDHSNILCSVPMTIAQAGLYGTGTEPKAFADSLNVSYEQMGRAFNDDSMWQLLRYRARGAVHHCSRIEKRKGGA